MVLMAWKGLEAMRTELLAVRTRRQVSLPTYGKTLGIAQPPVWLPLGQDRQGIAKPPSVVPGVYKSLVILNRRCKEGHLRAPGPQSPLSCSLLP